MQRKHTIRVIAAFSLIVFGLLIIGIGLLAALFALDASWLWLAFLGVFCIIAGVALVIAQLRKTMHFFSGNAGSAASHKRPIKHIKHE